MMWFSTKPTTMNKKKYETQQKNNIIWWAYQYLYCYFPSKFMIAALGFFVIILKAVLPC